MADLACCAVYSRRDGCICSGYSRGVTSTSSAGASSTVACHRLVSLSTSLEVSSLVVLVVTVFSLDSGNCFQSCSSLAIFLLSWMRVRFMSSDCISSALRFSGRVDYKLTALSVDLILALLWIN